MMAYLPAECKDWKNNRTIEMEQDPSLVTPQGMQSVLVEYQSCIASADVCQKVYDEMLAVRAQVVGMWASDADYIIEQFSNEHMIPPLDLHLVH